MNALGTGRPNTKSAGRNPARAGEMHSAGSESDESIVRTICGFCHANCGLLLTVRDGVVKEVKGDPEHPVNRGFICPKGKAVRDFANSSERLLHPLVRDNGILRQASWEEALDLVARKLLDIREKHGPEALVWAGGAVVSEETVERFVQLTAAFGSPNIAGNSHLCSGPRRIGHEAVYGPPRSEPDYDNAKLILMWGANPVDSHRPGEGMVYERYNQVLTRAKRRGARIVAIDPHLTPTVKLAHQWVQVAPGTDMALVLAMLNVIVSEGLYDQEFVARWVAGFEELQGHVREYTPEWAAPITRVPADVIRDLARSYATTKPAAIRDGNGLDMRTDAAHVNEALASLIAITGNLDVKGGNLLPPPVPLSPVPAARSARPALGAARYPLFPNANFPSVIDALITGEPYRPKAMIVFHGNPVLINANEDRVREALGRLEFLVVSDIFMTATAELADVVLPDVNDFEREGYRAQVLPRGWLISLRRKAVEPPGEARPALEVERELAARMGLADAFPWRTPEDWINYRLKPTGVTYADLQERSPILIEKPSQYRRYEANGFATPSKKVEVVSSRFGNNGYEALPTFHPTPSNPELEQRYPLVASSRKPPHYVHTKFRNVRSLQRAYPLPIARIHPQDAASRGIGTGDAVQVESPVAAVTFKALVSDEVPAGAVLIDFGWGNPGDRGGNVNRLADDLERDPVSSSTPNRAIRCQITKL